MEREIRCTEIYEAALALINEKESCAEDYSERAPYLLAACCGELGGLDASYRKGHSLSDQPAFGAVIIDLSDVFPLCNRFAPCAVSYLAAMLVLDENEELSDKLYSRYCDAVSTLCGEIPGSAQKIKDIYGY